MLIDHRLTVMGGPCTLRVALPESTSSQRLIQQVVAELRRLESTYSRYRSDSLISRINSAAGSVSPVAIDPETAGLCEFVTTLHAQSGGVFDPTAGVLTAAWDFRRAVSPSDEEIDRLLPLVGWDKVEWNADSIRLPIAGMALDFGGVVKEYAADAAIRMLKNAGVVSALVELAGDVATLGAGPGGQPWRVGIRHPRGSSALGQLPIEGMAMATSGDYERCMMIDGERFSHCVDPGTGRPVKGPASVTVLAAQCLLAGCAATTAMLKPVAQAKVWLDELGLPWFMVDQELNVTGPMAP